MDINQVAQMAGVSRATVSRYFNDGYVSQEKRAAIARVVEETGYAPSRQAKTLRTGKSGLVGIIIPKINSASVSRMVAGITGVLNEVGYQALLANTDNDAAREVSFLRLFSERSKVDGVILMATVLTPEHDAAIAALPVPLVVLSQELEGRSCVYQDEYGALRALTERVLSAGDRPAYIGVLEEDVAAGRRRREGFLAGCAARGVVVEEGACVIADFSIESGYAACERLMERGVSFDTLVCATDSIAYGAMACLADNGIAVPADVQVAAVGDSDISQVVTPSLTSVHYHYKTSGAEAARMLVGSMADEDAVAREIKMGYDVVVRASTRQKRA